MHQSDIAIESWAAIANVISEHVWLIDNGHADQALRLFAETTRLEMGPGCPKPAVYAGREAVKNFLELRAQQTEIRCRHVVSNIWMVARDDGSIQATSILTLYRSHWSGRETDVAFVADVQESYVRESDGKWRIADRLITPVFSAGI